MEILDLLFPKKCLECGRAGKYICESCLKKVPPGRFYNGNYSIFKYEGVIRKAIIALKYKYAAEIAGELAYFCTKELKKERTEKLLPSPYYLVPVPLHWRRQNFRGFNQVELIGEKLAGKMGWKFVPDLLIRTKSTIAQVELKGVERRKNLSNVFCFNPTYNLIPKTYHLVLFDDVYTTGSTIFEAKKALFNAGFRNIKSLTIAG